MQTPYEIREEMKSVARQRDWYKAHGLTSEAARLNASLDVLKIQLAEAEEFVSPAAVAARNASYEATMAEYKKVMRQLRCK